MRLFISDNNSGVHENIMRAIINANKDHEYAYGGDDLTKKATEKISELFDKDVDVYFVSTGTAANVIGISGLLRPYESVICADTAHINVDECGSLERFTGSKILAVPNRDGKIYKEDIKHLLNSLGDEHHTQPRLIYISQTTEMGTLYSLEEIKDLADFAHKNNMYLHLDGARIANAVVALDTTFKEMITDTGVDLVSFGGTKNGMMMGEAIICLDKDLSKSFKFHRKQGMQLLSKMRFVSTQFIAYLKDDLWRENAINANQMAKYLLKGLQKIDGIEIMGTPKTNMVFLYCDRDKLENLKSNFHLHVLDDDKGLVRLVTSFDTTKDDIDKLLNTIE